jgi:hypothetical protein
VRAPRRDDPRAAGEHALGLPRAPGELGGVARRRVGAVLYDVISASIGD